MTSNACVMHPPLDGGNNRWRENKGTVTLVHVFRPDSRWDLPHGNLTHVLLLFDDGNGVFCPFQSNLNSFFCEYDSREAAATLGTTHL